MRSRQFRNKNPQKQSNYKQQYYKTSTNRNLSTSENHRQISTKQIWDNALRKHDINIDSSSSDEYEVSQPRRCFCKSNIYAKTRDISDSSSDSTDELFFKFKDKPLIRQDKQYKKDFSSEDFSESDSISDGLIETRQVIESIKRVKASIAMHKRNSQKRLANNNIRDKTINQTSKQTKRKNTSSPNPSDDSHHKTVTFQRKELNQLTSKENHPYMKCVEVKKSSPILQNSKTPKERQQKATKKSAFLNQPLYISSSLYNSSITNDSDESSHEILEFSLTKKESPKATMASLSSSSPESSQQSLVEKNSKDDEDNMSSIEISTEDVSDDPMIDNLVKKLETFQWRKIGENTTEMASDEENSSEDGKV